VVPETSLDRTFLLCDEILCNLMEGRIIGKPTRGRRRLQMLDSLYENNGYEVPKRTAEDRSAWRESIRKKLTKTCCVQHTTEER